MCYTQVGYANVVVIGTRCELVGWPPRIPFGNPWTIPCTTELMELLVDFIECGIIRFVPAAEERVALARSNSAAVLPGRPSGTREVQSSTRRILVAPSTDLSNSAAETGAEESDIDTDSSREIASSELPSSDPIEEWKVVEAEVM